MAVNFHQKHGVTPRNMLIFTVNDQLETMWKDTVVV